MCRSGRFNCAGQSRNRDRSESLLGFKYENSLLKVKWHSLSLTFNGNLFKFTAPLISLVAGQTLEFFNVDNIASIANI